MGYPYAQLNQILFDNGRTADEFWEFMRGQTFAICEGRKFNHDTREYEPDCGGTAHGGVVYPWDVERFLDRKPVID